MRTVVPKKELIKNIKKEIEKCGFPLEIFVTDICSKKNTGRMPNQRYIYEGRLKELDLHAFFGEIQFNSEQNPQYTSSHLVIACKKSKDKPWVFFSSAMFQDTDSFLFLKRLSTYDTYFSQKKTYGLLGQIRKFVKENHYLDKKIPKCISYFEAFKKPSQESQIYDAIQSVLSFIRYHAQRRFERKLDEYDALTDFYYPIIVFEGDLFEAIIKDDETILSERNHLQIRTLFEGEISIIDVVKKEYFETFFDILEKDHNELVQAINKLSLPKEFREKILTEHKLRLKKFIPKFPIDMFLRKK